MFVGVVISAAAVVHVLSIEFVPSAVPKVVPAVCAVIVVSSLPVILEPLVSTALFSCNNLSSLWSLWYLC